MRCRALVAIVIAAGLAAGCGSDAAAPEPTEAMPEPTATPAAQTDGAGEAPVEAPTDAPVQTPTASPADASDDVSTEQPTDGPELVVDNDGLFPTVVAATASSSDGETWRFAVTLSSEYDSPSRYADAWRVLDANDTELGIRVLAHDHAGEQPFTRSTSVVVPRDTTTVYIEARDQLNGWNDERFPVTLER